MLLPIRLPIRKNYNRFIELREAAKKHNVEFRYGTNVGSALPIINTLKDLISSGDEIIKIEGIFSGTLSFIFNTLKEKDSFSEIVKIGAGKRLYRTGSRDDLSGLDMARKLLILIRESGVQFELRDIAIEKLISYETENAQSLNEFFERLKKMMSVLFKERKKPKRKVVF